MDILISIFLGIVQGLTEFLPVSSSGHLVLFQSIIPGFSQPGILFDVILHFGTLAAVLYYFRNKIFKLSFKYFVFLFIGTLPAVLAGLFFREEFESLFLDPIFLGFEFIITAIINFLVDKKVSNNKELDAKKSFSIGIAQAIAIFPAISRSGATIMAGVRSGLSKHKAAEFSFLLSVPAIIGANVLEIYSHRDILRNGFEASYLWGFLAAFVVGFFSIGIVMKFLKEGRFKYFGYYTLILGILIILFF